MMTLPFTLAQAAPCGYILVICVMVFNAMGKDTRHFMRASYLLLSVGALATLYSALHQPTWGGMFLAWGVALFLAGNERKRERRRAAR